MMTIRLFASRVLAMSLAVGLFAAVVANAQPIAKVLRVVGKPRIVAVNGSQRNVLVYGSIYVGESMTLPPKSVVVIGYRKTGELDRISSGNSPVVCRFKESSIRLSKGGKRERLSTKRQGLVAETIDSIEELSDHPAAGVTILRSARRTPTATIPISGSAIRETSPRFSWPKVEHAAKYLVQLKQGNAYVWSAVAMSNELAYPRGKKRLDPGRRYQLEVFAVAESDLLLEEIEYEFSIVGDQETKGLSELAAEDQPAIVALAAFRYKQLKMTGPAIELYEKLLQATPQETVFRTALAELYEQAGRPEDAAKLRKK